MEEGRLTDSFGRNVDFKNTIIIMTTNAGAEVTSNTNIFGFDRGRDDAASYEQMKERLKVAIEKYFRPEFLNRLDDVIVFHSLNKENLKQIVDIELAKVRSRLRRPRPRAGPDRRGQGVPHRQGLQPRLRGPAAAAGDREPDRGPARRGDPPRHLQGQEPGLRRGRGRGREPQVQVHRRRRRTSPSGSPRWRASATTPARRRRRQERLTPPDGETDPLIHHQARAGDDPARASSLRGAYMCAA